MFVGNEKYMQNFGHKTEAKRPTGSPTWTLNGDIKLIIRNIQSEYGLDSTGLE
jgi:hypothetical protein